MSKAQFVAEVRSARDALRQELARRDDKVLSEATIPGSEWTARDVLAHLIGSDRAILGGHRRPSAPAAHRSGARRR